jgi:TonB family protein
MLNGKLRVMLAHHRGPYRQSTILAAVILAAIFVFFPPFEFKPYRLQAEDFQVIEIPENFEIPPPPKEAPLPPAIIFPADDGEGSDDILPPTTFGKDGDFPEMDPVIRGNRGFNAFDQLPVPEYLASPVYPSLAREAGIEGTVLLRAKVGLDHKVSEAVILSSDVTPAMEKAAVEAALKCRYKPAKQRSIEVEVWVPILIYFQLN